MSNVQSFWKKLQNILLIIALIIMGLHVVIYIAFGVALIPFPFDYDQAEGFELNNAILLSQGDCPYCDNDVFPFYASGYAPFFHVLMVPFVWLFGANYWYGRLIIFLATFVTAGAISFAIWRDENRLWPGLLVGMAFLASNFIYHIGPLLRQHLLMVMFETLSVVLIANAFENGKKGQNWRIAIAFILLLLAGYTKQLAYSSCLALGGWLFLQNPRLALKYSSGLVIVAGVIFGWALVVTNGHWWTNIISSNQNEYITEQFVSLTRLFLSLHWPLVLLAILVTVYELYFVRLSVYSIWFVVSLASTVGAGKWGAGDSYYATTLAASCLLSGVFLAKTLNQSWQFPEKNYLSRCLKIIPVNSQMIALLSTVLFLIYGATVIKLPTSGIFEPISNTLGISPKFGHRYPLYDSAIWTVGYAVTGHFPSQEDYENGWYIVDKIKASGGMVLSEDAGFVIQAGQEVIANAVQLRNLWEYEDKGGNRLYDPANLRQMIENQEFSIIIRRGDFFPEPILVAIGSYYKFDEAVEMNGFAYQLWRPIENASNN
jgi:hypothetical protein